MKVVTKTTSSTCGQKFNSRHDDTNLQVGRHVTRYTVTLRKEVTYTRMSPMWLNNE